MTRGQAAGSQWKLVKFETRAGCISLSWGRKSAMAERIECEWSVTIAPEGSQRGHPTCART